MPLNAMTTHVQSLSANDKGTDDSRGAGPHDDLLATNFNVGNAGIIRKSADKKTHKLPSSLLVRGRHPCSTEKKEPSSQTTKTKAQDGNTKPSRSSIFVLLGLTD